MQGGLEGSGVGGGVGSAIGDQALDVTSLMRAVPEAARQAAAAYSQVGLAQAVGLLSWVVCVTCCKFASKPYRQSCLCALPRPSLPPLLAAAVCILSFLQESASEPQVAWLMPSYCCRLCSAAQTVSPCPACCLPVVACAVLGRL